MAVAKLEEAEVAADGVERFAVFERHEPVIQRARRHGAGLGPPFEERLGWEGGGFHNAPGGLKEILIR